MKIVDCILTKSYTGFYFDDQEAIKKGPIHDGLFYVGKPVTPGFKKIRQPGEAVSIQLLLEDGSVAKGDCSAVQYSGAGGRDPLFIADDVIKFMEENITPLLINEEITTFKELAVKYDKLVINKTKLHPAIRYGLTQALLNAVSIKNKLSMAEVIRKEYSILDQEYKYIPIMTQSGDERYTNVDKMIIKEVDALPHALINNVEKKLGYNGEILKAYLEWLRERILKVRNSENYNPVIHVDVYGTIGVAFNYNIERIINYLDDLSKVCHPFHLRVEGPVDDGSRENTINYLVQLRKILDERKIDVEIVADEWCNTLEDVKEFVDKKAGHMVQIKSPDLGGLNNIIEAVLYCENKDVAPYLGGSCNETDISTIATVNVALACKAVQILARPGMGTDEAIMITRNEISRVVALANRRNKM